MLVWREQKYTLVFCIVSVSDGKLLKKISHWNTHTEKALGGVVTTNKHNSSTSTIVSSWRSNNQTLDKDDASYAGSEMTSMSSSSTGTRLSTVLLRGWELLPMAGKVRARMTAPTPRLRQKNWDDGSGPGVFFAREDGYSSDTVCVANRCMPTMQLGGDGTDGM